LRGTTTTSSSGSQERTDICTGTGEETITILSDSLVILLRTLRRYLDDELVLGIDGDSIQSLTGAMIPEVRPTGAFTHLGTPSHNKRLHYTHALPQEPMYLILNTAISHRWGMPEPCPADTCSACWHCYDCTNPGEASATAILQPPRCSNVC
jgi:hypothetical protein